MKITVNTDGGSRGNPGPGAAGFVVRDASGNLLFKCGKYLGEVTNNQAEYQGVILALEWIAKQSFEEIDFLLDSSLVVNQINEKFRIKNNALLILFKQVKELEEKLGRKLTFSYVPREKNMDADLVVNETLDGFTG